MDEVEISEAMAQVEAALAGLDGLPPTIAERMADAVGALTSLYGQVLRTMVASATPQAMADWCDDPLVGHLLALHGLHPQPPAARAGRAAAAVLASFSTGLELTEVSVDGSRARVALGGRLADSKRSTAPALRGALEDSVLGAAPELDSVELEGLPLAGDPTETLITVDSVLRRSQAASVEAAS